MNWIYVMDEARLPEGGMAPVYPLGVNLVVARVGGVVYAPTAVQDGWVLVAL